MALHIALGLWGLCAWILFNGEHRHGYALFMSGCTLRAPVGKFVDRNEGSRLLGRAVGSAAVVRTHPARGAHA